MADFDYIKFHSQALYAPVTKGPVRKGHLRWCHSKQDEVTARQDGFTSQRYIQSEWPKSIFNKKTGECKPCGRLEWTDEQNETALAGIGPEWTEDHVPVPEPVAAPVPGQGGMDLSILLSIAGDIKSLVTRVGDIEDALVQSEAARIAAERRLSDIEGAISDAAVETVPAEKHSHKKGS